jgi:hypothetical protein
LKTTTKNNKKKQNKTKQKTKTQKHKKTIKTKQQKHKTQKQKYKKETKTDPIGGYFVYSEGEICNLYKRVCKKSVKNLVNEN